MKLRINIFKKNIKTANLSRMKIVIDSIKFKPMLIICNGSDINHILSAKYTNLLLCFHNEINHYIS